MKLNDRIDVRRGARPSEVVVTALYKELGLEPFKDYRKKALKRCKTLGIKRDAGTGKSVYLSVFALAYLRANPDLHVGFVHPTKELARNSVRSYLRTFASQIGVSVRGRVDVYSTRTPIPVDLGAVFRDPDLATIGK